MSKDPSSARGKPARRPAAPLDRTVAEDHSAPDQLQAEQNSSELSQTEAFTMTPKDEDEAADFLLGNEEGEVTQFTEELAPKRSLGQNEKTEFLPPKTGKKGASAKTEENKAPKKAPPAPGKETPAEATEEEANEEEANDHTDITPAPSRPAPKQKNQPAQEQNQEQAAPGGQKATVLGDFRLMKKLGQGGMGSVYKALQVSLEREVAVKVLARELSNKPSFVQRFLREARVMAKLDHPNILRCFDVGHAQGYHYLAMEFVDGGSVEGWLKKLGRFSLGDALHIILIVAGALQHAHDQGLIHRDIKPDNVLLTSKGVLKLADLGLAKATDDDLGLTKTGTGAGTPFYMAPEQARDVKHVDNRVDIYALGVMLYAFLTGEMPYKGETLVEVITAKEKGKFPSMRKFNDEVPEKLDLIVDKMLAPNPEHRYPSCAAVITDLEGLGLANEHLSFVDAPPTGAATRGAAASAAAGRTAAPKTSLPQGKSAGKPQTLAPRGATVAPQGPAKGPEPWFWSFTNEEGRKVTKKLSKDQLITLIKSGSIDTDAQVSRNPKTGFRAVATYGEFLPHLQKNIITEKVEKKGEKYRDMYKQIEAEEKSRLRWRGFYNFYLKLGGGVGFLLWMCIIIAALIAGYFGVKWLLEYLGATVAEKGGLK